MYLSIDLSSYISNDIVYMCMLQYLIFSFVRFVRGNKNNEKVAYVKEKKIYIYFSSIGYAIMYQVWCGAKQCKNNKQT